MDASRAFVRTALTTVIEQYLHVLALRTTGDEVRASYIYDSVHLSDFPAVMELIDSLAATGEPVLLPPEVPQLGLPLDGLVRSEQRGEANLGGALEEVESPDPRFAEQVDVLHGPRDRYGAWLTEQLGSSDVAKDWRYYPQIDPIYACMIAVLEHHLLRAFLKWNDGDEAGADLSWSTAGMCMSQSQALSVALAGLHAVPLATSSIPSGVPEILGDVANEGDLMSTYSRLAADAAKLDVEPSLRAVFSGVTEYTAALDDWHEGTPHPAQRMGSPRLASFAASRRHYMPSAAPPERTPARHG